MGRAGCTGWEKDCLKTVGTWVGVSVRIYDSIHLEIGPQAIAGTAQIRCGRWLTPASRWGPASSLHTSCVCVLLCFINPILGNRYGPGVSSC